MKTKAGLFKRATEWWISLASWGALLADWCFGSDQGTVAHGENEPEEGSDEWKFFLYIIDFLFAGCVLLLVVVMGCLITYAVVITGTFFGIFHSDAHWLNRPWWFVFPFWLGAIISYYFFKFSISILWERLQKESRRGKC
jgi:hypothetical protein